MGQKGSKLTEEITAIADELVARIAPLGDVSRRKMFGGCGIFESGTMFALIDSAGTPHLRVGDSNVAKFEQAGSKKHGKMPYYAVPDNVLKNTRSLRSWAKVSIVIAQAGKKN